MPVNMESFPIQLFRQSRDLAWDPAKIDFSRDREDWDRLSQDERDLLLRLVIGFLIGERGVTHDLAPLQIALRGEKGRMEEEMYLTAQLFEEAKHVEFFQLWMNAALPGVPGKDFPFPAMYGTFFGVELPDAMQALLTDPSPRAQLRATATYHQFVEGVLGETGYQVFYDAFEKSGMMPGLIRGVKNVQKDEVRHIAFGTYLCQRLIKENPELEDVFIQEMNALRPYGEDMPKQIFEAYTDGAMPFGLDREKHFKHNAQLWETRVHHVRRGQLVSA